MTILRQIGALRSRLVAWWFDHLEMALLGHRPTVFADPLPMRLVVRTNDSAVSIALIDPAGTVLFVEHANWALYSRAFFDRCLAKAEALARPGAVAVSVGLTHTIARVLMIPRRARSQVEDILRTQIRMKTPLRLEDVFLGHVTRLARDGRLEVRYLVTPRSMIERILRRLAIPAGAIATLENMPTGIAPEVIVPLAASHRATMRWTRRIALGLVVVVLLSAVLGFANLAVRQELSIRRFEADIAQLSRNAVAPTAEPRAAYAMRDDLDRFSELRSVPGILSVWEDIASALPLSTYLTEVSISDDALQIAGYSASATSLIETIEASATARGAVFTAPVNWVQSREKERFSIAASLRTRRLPAEER